MTYLPNFKVVNVSTQTEETTLYEAAKTLTALSENGTTGPDDNALIAKHGRAVAFYSFWHNQIRPAYSATERERRALGFNL